MWDRSVSGEEGEGEVKHGKRGVSGGGERGVNRKVIGASVGEKHKW